MQFGLRYFTLLIALFGVFYAVTACAIPASMTLGYDTDPGSGGIQNSHPHNLSSGASDNADSPNSIHAPPGGEDELCKFCHTPHGGSAAGPLWNRRDPIGPNADGTFPLYTGAAALKAIPEAQYTPAVAADASLYPNGATRLCLSCHDGVTAVGEVISGDNLAALTMSAFGTIDLSTSHPVSFTYTEAVRAALPGSYVRPAPGSLVKLDGNERMQCTTCHDPHNDTNIGGAYTLPMWRLYTGAEAADYNDTCLTCHNAVPGVGSLH